MEHSTSQIAKRTQGNVLPSRPTVILVAITVALASLQCGPDAEKVGPDGAPMVFIPAGEFLMGGKPEEVADHPKKDEINFRAERPLHKVRIGAFYMDKYEVTNARYDRFLQHVKTTGDTTMNHPDHPAGLAHVRSHRKPELLHEQQPVVGVSWYSANAYCSWQGKRLPTEAEWEYAGRGNEGYRVYPWGDQNPVEGGVARASHSPDAGAAKDGYEHSAPVGSYPKGLSPFGVADQAGNVEEWVQDWMEFDYYSSQPARALDPTGPASSDIRVIKGGSYRSSRHFIRIGTRLWGVPFGRSVWLGFRCAGEV